MMKYILCCKDPVPAKPIFFGAIFADGQSPESAVNRLREITLQRLRVAAAGYITFNERVNSYVCAGSIPQLRMATPVFASGIMNRLANIPNNVLRVHDKMFLLVMMDYNQDFSNTYDRIPLYTLKEMLK